MNGGGGGGGGRLAGSASVGVSGSAGKAQSLLRILREHREIQSEPNPYWCAYPLDMEEPYEWHFTIRGPADTEFAGGVYHGRIVLPQAYPFMPPSVMLLTQNGRFEVGKKVCLSASNYHPELWQPAWGLRTMLDALHAFFPTPGEGALHSLDWPADVRRKIAKESVYWSCPICKQTNTSLVEAKCAQPTTARPVLPAGIKNVGHVRVPSTSSSPAYDSNLAASLSSKPPPGEPSTLPASVDSGLPSGESAGTEIRQIDSYGPSSSNVIAQGSSTEAGSTNNQNGRAYYGASSSGGLQESGTVGSIRQLSSSGSTDEAGHESSSASALEQADRKGGLPRHLVSHQTQHSRRVRPERVNKSIISQLFRYPQTRLDACVCLADLLILLLLGAVFVLLLDLMFQPPEILSHL